MSTFRNEIDKLVKQMTCPNCGGFCTRDKVHSVAGSYYGPYGCICGWSSDKEYNQLNGPTYNEAGYRTSQWGREIKAP